MNTNSAHKHFTGQFLELRLVSHGLGGDHGVTQRIAGSWRRGRVVHQYRVRLETPLSLVGGLVVGRCRGSVQNRNHVARKQGSRVGAPPTCDKL